MKRIYCVGKNIMIGPDTAPWGWKEAKYPEKRPTFTLLCSEPARPFFIISACLTDRGEGAEVDALPAVGLTVALVGRLHAHLLPAQGPDYHLSVNCRVLVPPHEPHDTLG